MQIRAYSCISCRDPRNLARDHRGGLNLRLRVACRARVGGVASSRRTVRASQAPLTKAATTGLCRCDLVPPPPSCSRPHGRQHLHTRSTGGFKFRGSCTPEQIYDFFCVTNMICNARQRVTHLIMTAMCRAHSGMLDGAGSTESATARPVLTRRASAVLYTYNIARAQPRGQHRCRTTTALQPAPMNVRASMRTSAFRVHVVPAAHESCRGPREALPPARTSNVAA